MGMKHCSISHPPPLPPQRVRWIVDLMLDASYMLWSWQHWSNERYSIYRPGSGWLHNTETSQHWHKVQSATTALNKSQRKFDSRAVNPNSWESCICNRSVVSVSIARFPPMPQYCWEQLQCCRICRIVCCSVIKAGFAFMQMMVICGVDLVNNIFQGIFT